MLEKIGQRGTQRIWPYGVDSEDDGVHVYYEYEYRLWDEMNRGQSNVGEAGQKVVEILL